jgi:hypothetical protein
MATYGSAEWAAQQYGNNYYKPPAQKTPTPQMYGGYQPPSYYFKYQEYLKKIEEQKTAAEQARATAALEAQKQMDAQRAALSGSHAGFGRQYTRTPEQVSQERTAAGRLGTIPNWQAFYNTYYGGGGNFLPTISNSIIYKDLDPFNPGVSNIRNNPNLPNGFRWIDYFKDPYKNDTWTTMKPGDVKGYNMLYDPILGSMGTIADDPLVQKARGIDPLKDFTYPPEVLPNGAPPTPPTTTPPPTLELPEFPGFPSYGGYGGGGYSYPKYSASQSASKWYNTMVQWNIGNKQA